jgi:outer membrane lipoprotein-sorting protein
MRKFLLALTAFGAVAFALYYFLTRGEDVQHANQKLFLKMEHPVEQTQAVPVLDAINARNQGIQTFSCERLKVIAQMPGKRAARLNGTLHYQKENKFRLELNSILGSEIDIGSDGNVFWFWSKRLKDPGLHWAYYKDFTKTKLKTPFNPFWISHCLGIDKIDYKDATVDQSGNRWRVIKKTVNGKGENVTAVIYVDPEKKLVTGHGMYDTNGKLVASCEIHSYENNLPSKMTFIWHNENASMVWYLNDPTANVVINPSRWIMPNRTPKIDMSRE